MTVLMNFFSLIYPLAIPSRQMRSPTEDGICLMMPRMRGWLWEITLVHLT
jgi:hypothetical protein